MSAKKLIGKPAPSFKLNNYNGEEYEVRPGQTGLPLVIFYYPESGSYGCTREACQFRDAVAEKADFSPDKVQVIGISPNPVDKQKAFVEKEKLTYPVLSDVKKEVASAYGIGRGMFGLTPVARVTFVIDKSGTVRDVHDATMNYGAHIKFVEKALKKVNVDEGAEGRPTVQEQPKAPQQEAPELGEQTKAAHEHAEGQGQAQPPSNPQAIPGNTETTGVSESTAPDNEASKAV